MAGSCKEEEKKKLLSSTRGQLSPSQESELLGEVLGGAIWSQVLWQSLGEAREQRIWKDIEQANPQD